MILETLAWIWGRYGGIPLAPPLFWSSLFAPKPRKNVLEDALGLQGSDGLSGGQPNRAS